MSRFEGPKGNRDSPRPAGWMMEATFAEQFVASLMVIESPVTPAWSVTPCASTVAARTLTEASHQEADLPYD